ncbi:integrase [Methylorubrum extorquens]|uniref:integrase n=1 Tax=Methylorubrum extorquens TaxID=408 RepID=UPI003F61008F
MPRKPDPRNAYLELHDGYYRVTMGVPAALHAQLGKRLKRTLGTKSLLSANVLKVPIVREFKARIDKAWASLGGKKRSEMHEAVAWADVLQDAVDRRDPAHGALLQALRERRAEIASAGSTWKTDVDEEGDTYDYEVIKPEAQEKAEAFDAIARRKATPIGLHHDAFMKTLRIKPRSLTDDVRALAILLDWCRSVGVDPYLERIDIRTAVRFMDDIGTFASLGWASSTKYLGRLKRYWGYLLKRGIVADNPWVHCQLEKPDEDADSEERAFTDVEVQKLLMGSPPTGMMDVMLVAALTGARLDAVIDLRVGECADGWFTFKPQKKEKRARDVPIHPALKQLVAARVKGKVPEDDFFPEWPTPKAASTMRERSSYFSKRFTAYRRGLGVDDQIEGKRRSLVNFHSWRRWFITKMERAAVDGDLIAAIVGHKRSGLTLGRYSEGPEMQAAQAAIAKVRLPPLDGSPILEAQPLTPRRRRGNVSTNA